ncbi:hypothetical protein BPS10C_044 [Bacillus phage BPS10C]|uniref:Uncharacterized protein n=1 Tax=Bacillus phage BPS10C TaxID=1277886 RepID=W5QU68_9CAUD|nr:hypothetical protein BPS10C_044 [Bacillus phage BPS10C]AGI12041.1 hypothetical protein BPS10C_044 [Bacillus phage BPS10C]
MILFAVLLLICVVIMMCILGYLFKSKTITEHSTLAAIGFGLIISMWSAFLILMIIMFIIGGDIK